MSVSKSKRLCRRYQILDEAVDDDNMSSDEENSNGSDSDDGSEDGDIEENSDWIVRVTDMIPSKSYEKVLDQYTEDQKKLEPNHLYEWLEGEKKFDESPTNEIMLSESTIKKIRNASLTEVFEYFFSRDMKNYIIESTIMNDYELTLDDLNTFIGVIVMSTFNSRKSQKDYWSRDPFLACHPIAAAMSRDKFLKIKSKIKFSKPTDISPTDKAWRVRAIFENFRKNLKQFGYFSTSLSIDETMIKFYGRTVLKQYIKDKPEQWGIKQWSLCNPEGYLFDCDIYCGKGSNPFSKGNSDILDKCALGSKAVLQMTQGLLTSVSPRKIIKYHIYFDNYFSSPDLLVHLRNIGVRATGTVRSDRMKGVTNDIDKKSDRGSYAVKHDKNSGMNYITIMDSKPVSILSTAAGVTPLSSMERYSKEHRSKIELPFPNAFSIYNKNMGGVDLHDYHCSMLMPSIRCKKWTWVIFLRLIQASIANATVLKNMVRNETKKLGTKDIAIEIARNYLKKNSTKNPRPHKTALSEKKKNCTNFSKCSVRTQKICTVCNIHICAACFDSYHTKFA